MKTMVQMQRVTQEWRKLDEGMSLQAMAIFQHISIHGASNSVELQQGTGLSQSAVSRHCMALTSINRFKKPGYGLVEESFDPYERRRKIYRLTSKGEQFARKLTSILEGGDVVKKDAKAPAARMTVNQKEDINA